jgi:hypothetical protein
MRVDLASHHLPPQILVFSSSFCLLKVACELGDGQKRKEWRIYEKRTWGRLDELVSWKQFAEFLPCRIT